MLQQICCNVWVLCPCKDGLQTYQRTVIRRIFLSFSECFNSNMLDMFLLSINCIFPILVTFLVRLIVNHKMLKNNVSSRLFQFCKKFLYYDKIAFKRNVNDTGVESGRPWQNQEPWSITVNSIRIRRMKYDE